MEHFNSYNFSMDDSVRSDISDGSDTTSGDSGNDSHHTPNRSRAVVTKGSGQFRRHSQQQQFQQQQAAAAEAESSAVATAASMKRMMSDAALRMSASGPNNVVVGKEAKRHSTTSSSFMENARSSMRTIASVTDSSAAAAAAAASGSNNSNTAAASGNNNAAAASAESESRSNDVQSFTADLYDEFASRARGRGTAQPVSSSTLRYFETRNQFNDIDQSINLMFHEVSGRASDPSTSKSSSFWSRIIWPWSSSSSSSADNNHRPGGGGGGGQFHMKDTSMEDIKLDGTMYSIGTNGRQRRRGVGTSVTQHHQKGNREIQLRKKAQWWCLYVFVPIKILLVALVVFQLAYFRYKQGNGIFGNKSSSGVDDKDMATQTANGGSGSSSSGLGPSITILPPTGDIRIEAISQRIRDMGLTEKKELNRLNSIPFYALRWVSDVDEAMLDVNDDQLLERYALAVLCYSIIPERLAERHSSGEYWVMDHHREAQEQHPRDHLENWLSSKHICEWKGVECSQVNVMDGNETQVVNIMTSLYLNHSSIQGTIPGELRALTDLEILDLSYNQLTGSIPQLVKNGFGMRSLEFLKLDNNELDGKMPTFEGQKNIAKIHLQRNNLIGGLHLPHSSLAKVEELEVQHNKLQGTIPAAIESMTRLKQLRLDNNQFHDHLPYFAQMANMEVLTMEKNQFSGTIPSHWSKMHRIKSLSLGSNQLSGELPFALHKMTDLEHFWIADNKFTGEIPGFIGGMTHLVSVYLQDNQFTGTIPDRIGDLTSTYSFHAFGNQLEGTVPESVCLLVAHDALVDLKMDCATGNITCSCCTHCY